MPRGRKPGWAERGESGGRPKGSFTGDAPGRKTPYESFTVSGHPEECALVKRLAKEAGKSVSRYVLDLILNK